MDIREIANLMEEVLSGGPSTIILRPLIETGEEGKELRYARENNLRIDIESEDPYYTSERHIEVGAWARVSALVVAGVGNPGINDHFTNNPRGYTAQGIREINRNTNRRKYSRYKELREICRTWNLEKQMRDAVPTASGIDIFNIDRFGDVGGLDQLRDPQFQEYIKENYSALDYDMVVNRQKYKSIPDKFIIRDYFEQFITMNPDNVVQIIPRR